MFVSFSFLSGFISEVGSLSSFSAGPSNRRQRRIILTTDVAESSVTIPDVDLVIDCCTHKRPRWNPTLGFSDMGWTVNGMHCEERCLAIRTGRARSLCSAAFFCNMGSLLFLWFKRRCCGWRNSKCARTLQRVGWFHQVWKFEISCNVILRWRCLGVFNMPISNQPLPRNSKQSFLTTLTISKDEAKQRAGRTGRCRAGKVVRLVTREECLGFRRCARFDQQINDDHWWKSIVWVLHYSTIWIFGL